MDQPVPTVPCPWTTAARAAVVLVAALSSRPAVAGGPDAPAFKVGMTTRKVTPAGSFDWRGSRERTLKVTVWYPAQNGAKETPIAVPAADPLWQAGTAALDAAPAARRGGYPLVLLSHGTGGAGVQLAWLATALAQRGFVAAAVNHPGNSYEDVTTLEGFILRWQRARDLSAVLDGLLADPGLGGLIDAKRVGAAGHSLGGFTVIELAGGRTDLEGFFRHCAAHRASCTPPPEYANLNQQVDSKARTDPAFRAALEHAGDSYRDARIRAGFAMAPALGPSVSPASLASIAIPIMVVVGDADRVAPAEDNAGYYAKHIKGARLELLTGGTGHFVFLDLPTAEGKRRLPGLAIDATGPPGQLGVDRALVHRRVAELAIAFFTANLR